MYKNIPYWLRRSAVLVLVASLTACGGGSSNDAPAITPPPVQPANPATAGELKAATLLGTLSATEITAAVTAQDSRVQALKPLYGVTSYRIEYTTTGVEGQPVRASGLVSVPIKAAGSKSPVLSYQHGTIFRDAQAPSNNAVASEVSVVMASLGYIVVAADYVGYGVSKGTPHPYLLSAPSAASTIDLLTAAKTWRSKNSVTDNNQLFLVGYSEGGYVTMATHRALQESNSPHLQQLRLVVPGAGPYNVQATMDGLIDLVRDESPVLGALINPGFLSHLGGSAQREVRRQLLKQLLPEDTDVVIDSTFIDNFLSDDVPNMNRLSNIHDWKPNLPVRLYHGKDDRTVPYASSVSTLQAMQLRGAGDLVSLTQCPAVPASHVGCVSYFLTYMLGQLAQQAQDL